jgi:hypothetical protein
MSDQRADLLLSPRPAHDFAVTLLGGAARRALTERRAGRVLAVFQRSFYVESAAGGLACLGHRRIGAGPLNGLVALPERWDWAASGLRPGDPAEVRDTRLRLAGGVSLILRHTDAWTPKPPPAHWTDAALGQGLDLLRAQARLRAPAEGLSRLIPYFIDGQREPPAMPRDNPILLPAWRAWRCLFEWLDDRPSAQAGADPLSAFARGLLGLGPGLTPSGDDFIGGALIALRMLGQDEAARALAARALPLARDLTGKISRAHLACAAEGEGAAALHETLAALLEPDAARLPVCLEAIDAIGHCSGWDALAGATCVLAARAGGRGAT